MEPPTHNHNSSTNHRNSSTIDVQLNILKMNIINPIDDIEGPLDEAIDLEIQKIDADNDKNVINDEQPMNIQVKHGRGQPRKILFKRSGCLRKDYRLEKKTQSTL